MYTIFTYMYTLSKQVLDHVYYFFCGFVEYVEAEIFYSGAGKIGDPVCEIYWTVGHYCAAAGAVVGYERE